MVLRSLLIALVWLEAAAQAQVVKLPAEVRGGVGSWVIVAPEFLEGGKPRWRADAGLQEVRLDLLLPPESLAQLKGKVYTSAVPGRFRVEAWNAKGDVASEISTCWVVVGEPGPAPPVPPGPGPGPQPPPGPQTPLGRELQTLYEADATPDKAKWLRYFIEVHDLAVTAVLEDPKVATYGDFYAKLKAGSDNMMKDAGNLKAIRQRCAKEVTDRLGRELNKPLDKVAARNALLAVAAALREVK